jgi:transcriptional regulator with XRE-family HTH domain
LINSFSIEMMKRFDSLERLLMISPAQCRAARGLLDWSQQDLARAAEVGVVTIRQLEAGVNQPRRATLVVVRHTLEAAGVEFIADNGGGGVGVRFREVRRERPRD